MVDPLSEVVALLRPEAPFSKLVVASAPWAVRRTALGQPFYLAVLSGGCHLTVEAPHGGDTLTLDAGDFVLIPAARAFAVCSTDRRPPGEADTVTTPIAAMPGGARVGDPDGPVDVRLLVGHCVFGAPDAALLVSLLPQWVHVRDEPRLSTLVHLLADEARSERPARALVTARLLDVLLIEAFRSSTRTATAPGLVRGLADAKLRAALQRIHAQPADAWTAGQLARASGLSRSAFFTRFQQAVGTSPVAYQLAWRMALARQMLRAGDVPIAHIAERVGYSSVSAFGVAFTRHVGTPPGRYARVAGDGEQVDGADRAPTRLSAGR